MSRCRAIATSSSFRVRREGVSKVAAQLVALFIVLSSAIANAGVLPFAVKAALKQAGLPESSLGVWVEEDRGRKPVLSLGAERAMSPASVMKLVTTYSALELLGPAYSWKTEAYADGTLTGDTLNGALVLKGYGDPSLTLENFWLLLRDLRQRGLRDIRGGVVVDQSYFAPIAYDPGAFDNEPLRAYNAPPQALLVNFNAVRVRLLPQAGTGMVKVVADPSLSSLKMVSDIRQDNAPCGDWREEISTEVATEGKERVLTLAGRFPLSCGEKSFNLNVLSNGSYVDSLIHLLWEELGGTLGGPFSAGELPPGASLLARHDSPPLADVIRHINKFSNNVMARQLFLTLGAEQGGPPATAAKSVSAVHAWLASKALDFPELVLENGSGLSRVERISPQHLGELLLAATRSPVFAELESSLPIVAVDGTMKKRLTDSPIAGHAHVKTGSLEGVRSVAGYVFDRRGRRMVVVAMVNHPRAAAAKPVLDALLQWVYSR